MKQQQLDLSRPIFLSTTNYTEYNDKQVIPNNKKQPYSIDPPAVKTASQVAFEKIEQEQKKQKELEQQLTERAMEYLQEEKLKANMDVIEQMTQDELVSAFKYLFFAMKNKIEEYKKHTELWQWFDNNKLPYDILLKNPNFPKEHIFELGALSSFREIEYIIQSLVKTSAITKGFTDKLDTMKKI